MELSRCSGFRVSRESCGGFKVEGILGLGFFGFKVERVKG